MGFAKAAPQQARLKVSCYGGPGSGKTFTTLLFAEGLAAMRGGRIAYIDTERGTDFYAKGVTARPCHPAAFEFDALYTRSLSEAIAEVKKLDAKRHPVLVIDSISHMWQAAIEAYEGRRTSIDSIPIQAWGKIKKPYFALLDHCMASMQDVFILGRQKNLFSTSDDGEFKSDGVAMRAEGSTQYEPHICLRMEAKVDKRDPTKSAYLMYVEKDRTGVLAGRTIANPTFKTIEPLLPLLGEVQAQTENEEERVAADSELLAAQDDKARGKEEKSAGFLAEFTAKIAAATDLNALAGVGDEAKKVKRYLIESHGNVLRELYQKRRDDLANALTGGKV